jgi:hypothetical protein
MGVRFRASYAMIFVLNKLMYVHGGREDEEDVQFPI